MERSRAKASGDHGKNGGAGRKQVGMDLLVVQEKVWEVTLENPNNLGEGRGSTPVTCPLLADPAHGGPAE